MTKIFKLLIAVIISYAFARIILYAVVTAYNVSYHPGISLAMRMLSFVVFTILIILRKKEYVLYLFIISYPFFKINFSGISIFTIMSVILVCVYFRDIVAYIKKGNDIYRNSLILICISVIYTTMIAKYPYDAIEKLLYFLCLCGLYYVANAYLFESGGEIKYLLVSIVGLVVFSIVVILIQIIFGINSIKFFFYQYNSNVDLYGYVKRIPSIFWEAQMSGLFYAFMSIICFGLGQIFEKYRIIANILSLCCIIALILSGTRMALIGLVIAVFVYNVIKFNFKKVAVLCFIICSTIFIISMFDNSIVPGRIKERFEKEQFEESSTFRFMLWERSFPIILNNPLGVGMGGRNVYEAGSKVNAYFRPIFSNNIYARRGTEFESAYLEILYSLGIPGFVGFILLVIRYLTTAFRIYKSKSNTVESKLSLYLISVMVVLLVSIGTSPKIYEPQAAIMFVICLATINYFSAKDDVYKKLNLR